jgi:glycosyltransferase involved in cell wall biosynthesis
LNSKNKKLTISLAMCTYDGAKYLQEQLTSIMTQTRLPDELVVCDDGSTDTTLDILDKFFKNAPFEVKVYHNKKRLGPTKNFEKAISLCKGDIIFLSDQDDVWLPHKLATIVELFLKRPDVGYIFSNALVVDEKLFPLGYTMWGSVLFTTHQRRSFKNGYQLEILLKYNVVTGATMAFRKNIKDLILPIPDVWVHDEWIALLSSALEIKGDFIEDSLIKYRQHFAQLIGGRKLKLGEQLERAINTKSEFYQTWIKGFENMLNRLLILSKPSKKTRKLFEDKIIHLQARHWMHNRSRRKRYSRIVKELISGRYHHFSNGWKSVIKDIFL